MSTARTPAVFLCTVVAAATLSFAAAPAAAQKKGAQWVALIQVRGDAPASWSDALRAAAEEARDRTWVPPPAVSIADAQLALGCSGWNDQCAGQIASMTGATMALVVDLNGAGNGAAISVQVVKAGGGAVAGAEKMDLPGKTPADLKLAEELVRGVVKGQRPAFLFVDTDTPKAEVWLDGQKVGETPWRGRVDAGDHNLVLKQEGKAPLTRQLNIKPGTTTTESHSLGAAGPPVDLTPEIAPDRPPHEVLVPVEPPPTAAEAPTTTTVGWSLVGVGGALGLAGAVFLGATVIDLNYREPCEANPDGCVPNRSLLFGIYGKEQRADLFLHQTAWITGSIAALGVGGLVVATGVVLANPPDENATPPPPAGAIGR
jgi:hypothetical protein